MSEPGAYKRKLNGTSSVKSPKRSKKEAYDFGNYNRYYGYRNVNDCKDGRLEAFDSRKEIFANKDVLDIGCNIGHVTYTVAKEYHPKSVLGVDIDETLVRIARKNRRYYCDDTRTNGDGGVVFPHNVSFIHGNYVLRNDDLLSLEEARFDVIMCLSVTKWVHLNWGDDGLRRLFRRVYAQLRVNGVFVLEAQPWSSYMKKKISAKLRKNCHKIKFLPEHFEHYLLSEIGFKKRENLAIPAHSSKGFQRPIVLFYK